MPKLRPIIGHEAQREALAQDIAQGNVAHAYLFSGPEHLGKMSLALSFARDLLSVDADEEERKRILNRIEKLTHPDLLVLDQLWIEETCEDWGFIAQSSNVPQVERSKKPAAKTDTISIDDIRAIHSLLYGKASGRYRVCIIRSIERMQDAAATSFLKILEEPPERLVFLLTTENPGSLLPTIVSRSRVVDFRRLPTRELRQLLAGIDEDDARFILHLAHGAPGIAALLRDDPDLLRKHRMIHGTAQAFWQSKTLLERMKMLSPLHERGEESDVMLLHLGLTLRERMLHTSAEHVRAFAELASGLESNAHRQLLCQSFAMEVSA